MRTRIKPESADTTIGHAREVNILQKLTLVLGDAGIFETGAVFQPGDVTTNQTGSASVQAANEYVSASVIIAAVNSDHFCSGRFFLLQATAVSDSPFG
jgi:hypothetical protein